MSLTEVPYTTIGQAGSLKTEVSQTPSVLITTAQHNPYHPSFPYYHIPAHTSGRDLLHHQRPGQSPECQVRLYLTLPAPTQHNPKHLFSPHHHILDYTSGRSLLLHQRQDQHPESQIPGQLSENQAEIYHPTRSQTNILNPRGPLARSEATPITNTLAPSLGKKLPAGP